MSFAPVRAEVVTFARNGTGDRRAPFARARPMGLCHFPRHLTTV